MNRRVLNLGAGTQSSVLYLMMCRGELPPAEVAIFADTQWEPRAVYEHLVWMEREGAGRVPIVKVTAGNLRTDAIDFRQNRTGTVDEGGRRFASMPLFVLNPDGSQGIIRRQCTSDYKIEPIQQYIRRTMLGLAKGQRVPKGTVITQVFGISFDERQRMRRSPEAWASFEYPLVDMKMRRQQVIEWAERHYPGRTFPRSACIGCPYHSNAEWRHLRDTDPEGFADAIAFDAEIRRVEGKGASNLRKLLIGPPFVHRSLKPLSEVKIDEDGPGLWDGVADNECEGMCGV